MKKILPLFLAALTALASCSKSEDAKPASTPTIVGSWGLTAERTVTTPKNGGAATTFDKTITAGVTTVAYSTAGGYTVTTTNTTPQTGTYTLNGTALSTVLGGRTTNSTVSELSTNKLVVVASDEDTNNRYVTTDTFTR